MGPGSMERDSRSLVAQGNLSEAVFIVQAELMGTRPVGLDHEWVRAFRKPRTQHATCSEDWTQRREPPAGAWKVLFVRKSQVSGSGSQGVPSGAG